MTSAQIIDEPSLATRISQAERNRTHVRLWLGIVLLVLFALVLVGGATRLTESGLSITEWKPIHGVIPPLSAQEWERGIRALPEDPAIPADQSGHDGRSVQDDLLVGMGPSPAGAHHRPRLCAAARILLAARPHRAKAEAALARHPGAWRISGLRRLVDGILGPRQSHGCQPVSARNPSGHRLSDLCLLHVDHAGPVTACRGRGTNEKLEENGRHHRWHGAFPDLPWRACRRSRCGPQLQHLAADGRRAGAGRSVRAATVLAAISSRTPRRCSSFTEWAPMC